MSCVVVGVCQFCAQSPSSCEYINIIANTHTRGKGETTNMLMRMSTNLTVSDLANIIHSRGLNPLHMRRNAQNKPHNTSHCARREKECVWGEGKRYYIYIYIHIYKGTLHMASHESECVYIARIVCIVLGCTGVERRRASRRHKMVLIIACECHWHSAFGHLQHPQPASMSSKLYSPEDGHRTTTTIRPPAHRQRLVYLWETDAAGSSSSLVKIPLGSRWLLSG